MKVCNALCRRDIFDQPCRRIAQKPRNQLKRCAFHIITC
jgi:hypothetical protein